AAGFGFPGRDAAFGGSFGSLHVLELGALRAQSDLPRRSLRGARSLLAARPADSDSYAQWTTRMGDDGARGTRVPQLPVCEATGKRVAGHEEDVRVQPISVSRGTACRSGTCRQRNLRGGWQ